ncbi:hypothetical protein [Chitinophaga vietnamensis]|uniref:hypothetical protein n=1 Tax=Chitinophaga vietnamensis TaxID=2593957 RepID=UPI00191C53B2|nr:hypothetical protein [Chitinophaga vietnamensis]
MRREFRRGGGMNPAKKIGLVIMGLLFFAAVIFVTMSLWNWLIPELFHGPVITYWQALGLLILGKLLFGWHGHHGGWGGWRRRREWKERLRERMADMTPEQREQIKERLRECWGSRYDRRRRYDFFNEEDDRPGEKEAGPSEK